MSEENIISKIKLNGQVYDINDSSKASIKSVLEYKEITIENNNLLSSANNKLDELLEKINTNNTNIEYGVINEEGLFQRLDLDGDYPQNLDIEEVSNVGVFQTGYPEANLIDFPTKIISKSYDNIEIRCERFSKFETNLSEIFSSNNNQKLRFQCIDSTDLPKNFSLSEDGVLSSNGRIKNQAGNYSIQVMITANCAQSIKILIHLIIDKNNEIDNSDLLSFTLSEDSHYAVIKLIIDEWAEAYEKLPNVGELFVQGPIWRNDMGESGLSSFILNDEYPVIQFTGSVGTAITTEIVPSQSGYSRTPCI